MFQNNTILPHDAGILIIGTGTFGISTAHHLATRGYTNITCIDRHAYPSVDSVGNDLNKIARTEYDEPLYVTLALEALEAWRQPEWEGIFHETGRMTTTAGSEKAEKYLNDSYNNLVKAGQAQKVELVQGKEQIVKHVPQLENATGVENWNGLFNGQGGWTHARHALEKWAEEAQNMGVRFVSGLEGTMTGLEIDQDGGDGDCGDGGGGELVGIKVTSGNVLKADRYILSTGAASPEVIPELSEMLWSKSWTLAHIELSEEEVKQWAGIPVIDHFELGFTFEPDQETRRVKICDNNPGYQYRVGTWINSTGQLTNYSIPRYASDFPQDGIPQEAEIAINKFIDTVMPQFSGRPLLDARVCWCTDTPDSHWLIDNHPAYGNKLLLVTGDSGHAFKMFPIIGKYIADAMEGKPEGLKKEWRFGKREGKASSTRPDSEIKDLRDVL